MKYRMTHVGFAVEPFCGALRRVLVHGPEGGLQVYLPVGGVHMSQLLPGLHRIKLPLPGTSVGNSNAYVVEDARRGHLLIDTGWNLSGVRKAFHGWFGGEKPALAEVGRLVLTHAHMDHMGMAGEVKEASGCEVFAHANEARVMQRRMGPDPGDSKRVAAYLLQNGVPETDAKRYFTYSEKLIQRDFVPLTPDRLVESGQVFRAGEYRFVARATPGHSPGHLCLYEPDKKILISGDHVLPGMKPNIGLYPGAGENPLGNYVASLKKIKDLDVKLVLPGHREPFADLAGAVDATQKRIAERAGALLSALAAGQGTAYDLAGRLPWRHDKGGLGWEALNPFDRRLALQEIVAHLAELQRQGLSASTLENGLIYHRLADVSAAAGK